MSKYVIEKKKINVIKNTYIRRLQQLAQLFPLLLLVMNRSNGCLDGNQGCPGSWFLPGSQQCHECHCLHLLGTTLHPLLWASHRWTIPLLPTLCVPPVLSDRQRQKAEVLCSLCCQQAQFIEIKWQMGFCRGRERNTLKYIKFDLWNGAHGLCSVHYLCGITGKCAGLCSNRDKLHWLRQSPSENPCLNYLPSSVHALLVFTVFAELNWPWL